MTPDADGDMDTEYAGVLAGHRRNPTARQVEGFLFPLSLENAFVRLSYSYFCAFALLRFLYYSLALSPHD